MLQLLDNRLLSGANTGFYKYQSVFEEVVWVAQIVMENKTESSDISGVNSILNSLNFIKKP